MPVIYFIANEKGFFEVAKDVYDKHLGAKASISPRDIHDIPSEWEYNLGWIDILGGVQEIYIPEED